MSEKQSVADKLKVLATTYTTGAIRKSAYESIQAFERAPWQPVAFDDALRIAPGIDEDLTTLHRPEGVTGLIHIYFGLIGYAPPPAPAGEMLTSAQTAEYLGVTLDAIDKYVQRDKWLVPAAHVGRSRMFAVADVEALRRKLAKNKRSKAAIARHAVEE